MFRNLVIIPQLQTSQKMLILRNFSKFPNKVETILQKLHFVSFAKSKRNCNKCQNQVFKGKKTQVLKYTIDSVPYF